MTLEKRLSAGTAAAGIGSAIRFSTDNDAGTSIVIGNIKATATDVSAGSFKGEMVFATRETSGSGGIKDHVRITNEGKVGVGNTLATPTAQLHVVSTNANTTFIAKTTGMPTNIMELRDSTDNIVFRVEEDGDVFADGVYSVGADLAEMFPVIGDKVDYEPGDVLVIDHNVGAAVALSSEPYSTRVAGIYSTKPGFLGRLSVVGSGGESEESYIPVALVGIVPCKVSAENGPIQPGDLLVTSSIPGHAMKCSDPFGAPGAIIGKAWEAWPSGTDVIQVLVTLR